MHYSQKLIELRKQHNLSQADLAKKLFVTRQAVSLWEKGKTSPSIDTLLLIKQLYSISLDEWSDNTQKENLSQSKDEESKRKKIYKPILSIICIILAIFLMAISAIILIQRHHILKPIDVSSDVIIERKSNITINTGRSNNIVLDTPNKPLIKCDIPDAFTKDLSRPGIYLGNDNTFIKFNSDFGNQINNPLIGTIYYPYYERSGHDSYIEAAMKAMYIDLDSVNIFSQRDDLYWAGGARILRQQLCVGQNASYYGIDGGLTSDLSQPQLFGFALHFEDGIWLITLNTYNDHYYYITIKDSNGIGASIHTVSEFLSTINIVDE